MSTHRLKEKVKPGDFPALAQFFGGYLHQDFLLDHESAPAVPIAQLAGDGLDDGKREKV